VYGEQPEMQSYSSHMWFPDSLYDRSMTSACRRCADGRQPIYDIINASVEVGTSDSLMLSLNSSKIIESDAHHLPAGIKIFHDLIITAHHKLLTDGSAQSGTVANNQVTVCIASCLKTCIVYSFLSSAISELTLHLEIKQHERSFL
jgi:hypothetical protein